ncbi:hypothetical protein ACWC5C_41540 [Streptomyces sp. NPDC001700]
MAAALGAVTLLAAPTAQAAPPAAAATAKPDCITGSEETDFGRGEIKACVQSNGKTRVTGYIEDLLPGVGWWGDPDGACVSWYLSWTGPDGEPMDEETPFICPHFTPPPSRETKKQLDYEYESAIPVEKVRLGRFWM